MLSTINRPERIMASQQIQLDILSFLHQEYQHKYDQQEEQMRLAQTKPTGKPPLPRPPQQSAPSAETVVSRSIQIIKPKDPFRQHSP